MIQKKILLGMFFVFAIVIFSFSVFAQTGSFARANVQFTQPGISSTQFLRGQGIDLNPALFGGSVSCVDGQDFVVQIAPLGCTPAVVRSDLLEEQNVAVFCPLAATKINPLIQVDAIDSISFVGNKPQGVSGIGFHPARAAVKSSSSTLLNSPVLSNVGYVVVVLARQPDESKMPDFVSGNLTANLRYDINNAFGIGQAVYSLSELTDEEWGENFKRYGFWNGKGFLRVDNIDGEFVTVSIYSDEDHKITSATLRRGQPSGDLHLPGFYCQAAMQLRLEQLENPNTKARVTVGGDTFDLAKGDRFLENKCTINELENNGLVQRIKTSCRTDSGVENFQLVLSPRVKISLDSSENTYKVGDKLFSIDGGSVYLAYLDYAKNDKGLKVKTEENLIAYFYKGNEGESLSEEKISLVGRSVSSLSFDNVNKRNDVKALKFNVDNNNNIFGKNDVKLIGFAEPQNKEINVQFKDNYGKALSDYNDVFGKYGLENSTQVKTFGEEALTEAIKLARDTNQFRDVAELCVELKKNYPNNNNCGDKFLLSNDDFANAFVSVNGFVKSISFEGIYEPSVEDFGVEIVVRKGDKVETYILGKNEFRNLNDDGNEWIQLVDIRDGVSGNKNVVLNINVVDNNGNNIRARQVVLDEKKIESFDSAYSFSVSRINLKKYAKISVNPKIENAGSKANFSFNIGIEKRAIQLSPDKIQDKIDNLNQSIEKWSEISDNLGTAVSGFKAACLATGAGLTIKNFFTNLDGSALARQEVMKRWTSYCDDEVNARRSVSMDKCFLDKNDAIEKEVELYSQAIKNTGGVTPENVGARAQKIGNLLDGDVKSALTSEGYTDGKITIQQVRDLETIDAALRLNPSAEFKSSLEKRKTDILKEIGDNARSYSFRSSWASESGVVPSKVNILEVENAKEMPYYGLKGNQIGKLKSGDYANSPVAMVMTTSGRKYFVVLDESSGTDVLPVKLNNNGQQIILDDGGNLVANGNVDVFKNVYFKKYDATSYNNQFNAQDKKVRYFETEPYKGLPAIVPFDTAKGWYVATKQSLPVGGNVRAYDDSGKLASFTLCNVGKNGRPEHDKGFGDDICRNFNINTGQIYGTFPGLDERETNRVASRAIFAVQDASRGYRQGVSNVKIGNEDIQVGSPAANVPAFQCQDFMSPSDCNLLFNVCDPVICPSSRCDLGGTYPVSDVVQSGIVGSLALCLPNARENIAVPVCLTGVKAGIDGLLSISKNYQKCLQTNLDTGQTVGICDEIHSIYMCEFFWRQALPLTNVAVPKIFELLTGQGKARGGGEYLTVQSAWNNAESSVNYMTQYYGANSFAAFNARSTEEAGSAICKNFISARYPTSGDFFGALIQPDSPPQFHAWFNEIPYTTATVPPTSQYKVFYHIFSGNDAGIYYSVYMKGSAGVSFFQTNQILPVANGYIPRGEAESQTKDFTAPSGYKELCVRVNDKEECGFKEVSTSFALDYLKDKYVEEQAKESVTTEAECAAGSSSLYSFVQPNLQEGVDDFVNPDLSSKGIVRICSTASPGKGTDASWNNPSLARWRDVGYCGNQAFRCWLDTKSVKGVVESTTIEGEILQSSEQKFLESLRAQGSIMSQEDYNKLLIDIGSDSGEDVVKKITDDVLDKVILNSQKARLLMERASAYGKIALGYFNVGSVSIRGNSIPNSNSRFISVFDTISYSVNDENNPLPLNSNSATIKVKKETDLKIALNTECNDINFEVAQLSRGLSAQFSGVSEYNIPIKKGKVEDKEFDFPLENIADGSKFEVKIICDEIGKHYSSSKDGDINIQTSKVLQSAIYFEIDTGRPEGGWKNTNFIRAELLKRTGNYEENKIFIDELYADGILNNGLYREIKEGKRDLSYLKNLWSIA